MIALQTLGPETVIALLIVLTPFALLTLAAYGVYRLVSGD